MDVIEARRRILLNMAHLESATGNPITFSKGEAAPLKKCVVNFAPVQAGSGDPSPSNIRPISGWNGVTVNVSNNASGVIAYPVDWANEAGTVYRGYADLTTGEIVATWGYIRYVGADSESWNVESGRNFYIMTPPEYLRGTNSERLFCNAAISRAFVENGTCRITSSGNFNINIGNLIGIDNVPNFKAWLSLHNVEIAVEYNNPIRFTIDPAIIKTLQGTNNIWSDANGNIELSYWTH